MGAAGAGDDPKLGSAGSQIHIVVYPKKATVIGVRAFDEKASNKCRSGMRLILTAIFVLSVACIATSQTSNRVVRVPDQLTIRSDINHNDLEQLSPMIGIRVVTIEGIAPLRPTMLQDILTRLDQASDLERLSVLVGTVTDSELMHLKFWKKLRAFVALENEISDQGLANLEGLTGLEELNLDFNNRITGRGLKHLRGLKKLKVLRLFGAPIDDAGLAEIRDLNNLENLQIGNSRMTDVALTYVAGFRKLRILDLQGTEISNDGLVYLENLKGLRWLCLKGTNIDSAGMSHLKDLVNLQWLFVNYTRIDDKGLLSFYRLASLKTLDLSSTRISDRGLVYLAGVTSLEDLRLNLVRITDNGLAFVRLLSQLRCLEIFGTGATVNGIAELSKALPQTEIRITRNF